MNSQQIHGIAQHDNLFTRKAKDANTKIINAQFTVQMFINFLNSVPS